MGRASNLARRVGVGPWVLLAAAILPLPGRGNHLLGLPPLCPFRALTSWPCPGCGITRSVVCAAHGHVAEAFAYHPLGPLVVLALLIASVRHWVLPATPVAARFMTPLWWTALITLLALWAARLFGWLPIPPP